MEKTQIVIEMLIIGLIMFIAVSVNVYTYIEIDKDEIIRFFAKTSDYSSGILFAIFSVSYVLGWLNNLLATFISKKTYFQIVRKQLLGDEYIKFEKMRDAMYLNASDNAVNKVKERLHGIRIFRTTVLSLILLIIGLLPIANFGILIAFFTLLMIFIFATYQSYKDYASRIVNIYRRAIALNYESPSARSDSKNSLSHPARFRFALIPCL